MRRIICARVRDTEEFDVVSTTYGCPLVAILPHLRGESFDVFFSALVEVGIIKFEHGHPTFVETPGPCPYTQTRQTEDKQS